MMTRRYGIGSALAHDFDIVLKKLIDGYGARGLP